MKVIDRKIQAITVAYSNGDVETFHPIEGHHIARRNYDKGLPNPGNPHIQHEVTWRTSDG